MKRQNKWLSLLMALAMTLSLAAPAFAAEEPAPWYAEAQAYVTEKGLMTGTEAGFAPEKTLTRAEVVQVLFNREGKPAEGAEKAAFNDLKDQWYADAAHWAGFAGLVAGDKEGNFKGEEVIARAETAQLIADYSALKGIGVAGGMAVKEASDYDKVPADYLGGVDFCYNAGIMTGNDKGELNPAGRLSRAEFAQILMKFDQLVPDYTTEHVTVMNGERAVPAVITLPVGEGKFPGVVMNHGHGGSKDENVGFVGVAAALAEAGIASIRMDFPGCGESTESFTENYLTNMISDSNACKDYLVANAPVDKDALGILGYSMGGRVALEIVTEKDNPYRATALLAGSTKNGAVAEVSLMGGQNEYNKMYAQASGEQGYAEFPWFGASLKISKAWFDDMRTSKPLEKAAKYTAPLLVMYGDKDTTVTMEENEATVAAFKQAQAIVVPEADHGYGFYSDQPAVTAQVEGSITGFFQTNLTGKVSGSVASISKYGNVTTDIPTYAFEGAGYVTGDILRIIIGEEPVLAPYGTGYSNVDNGQVIVLPDTTTNTVAAAVNMGNFAKTYGLEAGSAISFEMKEKEGYLEEYEIRNIDSLRTNERKDYASDAVFANFREVKMGDIPAGRLYRTSSPVNPELGRNTYADALLKKAGVKTVLNLADDEAGMKGYEGFAESYYAGLDAAALNMGVDFAAEDFNTKLKTGLEFMIAHEGPYAVHCNEGKDRAGFVAALLEGLCGANSDEIVEDYMLSYENYYHVEHHSDRWYSIAKSNIIKSLCTITGAETEEAMKKADLGKSAETYLTETVGMTAEQVGALYNALTKA